MRCALALFLLCTTVPAQAGIRLAPAYIESLDSVSHNVVIDGAQIDVHFANDSLIAKRDMLLRWVAHAAQVVHHYYGRFPVNQVSLELQTYTGRGIRDGRQLGGKLPRITVTVGEAASDSALQNDWILVHEMTHLALAGLPNADRWLEEGIAVYVSTLARARVGDLNDADMWREFMNSIPNALSGSATDADSRRARTYWGGALFCLLADVEIRKQTKNRESLRSALRAILNAGYSTHVEASTHDVLNVGDAAIGASVLLPAYTKLQGGTVTIDLPALWRSMGVTTIGDAIAFSDSAQLAHIRRSLSAVAELGR